MPATRANAKNNPKCIKPYTCVVRVTQRMQQLILTLVFQLLVLLTNPTKHKSQICSPFPYLHKWIHFWELCSQLMKTTI